MYFDLVLKRIRNEKIRNKIFQVEKSINESIEKFVDIVDKSRIKAIGVGGPLARSEGVLYFSDKSLWGSDVDIFIILESKNPFISRKILTTFHNCFKGCGVEAFPHLLSVRDFRTLFYFEFSSQPLLFYGDIEYVPEISSIPRWEAFRLLEKKTSSFFREVRFEPFRTTHKFKYLYSRAILACGEALLLFERKYFPSFKKRLEMIKKSKLSRKVPNFINYYKKAHEFRFYIKRLKESEIKLFKECSLCLAHTWKLCLEKYYKKNYLEALKCFVGERAPFPPAILTRIASMRRNFSMFRRIINPLKEPFIEHCVRINLFLEDVVKGRLREKERWKVSEYSKSLCDYVKL